MGLSVPKQFYALEGKPIVAWTLERVLELDFIHGVVLAVPPNTRADLPRWIQPRPSPRPVTVVSGGRERQESVRNALAALPASCEWVIVHDGVRPFASPRLFRRTWEAARESGAAICACPALDTVKMVRQNQVVRTLNRKEIRLVQTPQVFRRDLLAEAYRRADQEGWEATDEATLLERCGFPVRVVDGERTNLKITVPEDLQLARSIICDGPELSAPPHRRDTTMRIGMGYDVHRFVSGRPLVLGGIEIPHDRGLLGHSDADVLIHALCDALLGAAALGDLGRHFPDTDPEFEGISSRILLDRTRDLLRKAGLRVANADVTVVAQRPKLAPFIPEMRRNLAAILKVPEDAVSVKATTTEGLGYTGREEGIAAYAVVLLKQEGEAP